MEPREKPRVSTPEEMLAWARGFAAMWGKIETQENLTERNNG